MNPITAGTPVQVSSPGRTMFAEKFSRLLRLWLLVLVLGGPWATARGAKPNIVLVFIDDMGWADFSCFGNEDAKTPNIDRLANEGICFEQFYVNSPLCS